MRSGRLSRIKAVFPSFHTPSRISLEPPQMSEGISCERLFTNSDRSLSMSLPRPFIPFNEHVRRLTDKAARTGDEDKGSFFNCWHFLGKWLVVWMARYRRVDGQCSWIHRLGLSSEHWFG